METQAVYQVAQHPHARIPKRWLPLLYRLATFGPGQTVLLSVTIPDKQDDKPTFAVLGSGKVENEG